MSHPEPRAKETGTPRWQDLAATWGRAVAMPGESMADVDARLARMWRPEEPR